MSSSSARKGRLSTSSSSQHHEQVDYQEEENNEDDGWTQEEKEQLQQTNRHRENIRKHLRDILERVTKTKRSYLQFSSQSYGYQSTFDAIMNEVRDIYNKEISNTGNNVRELKLDAVIMMEFTKLAKSYFDNLVQSGNKCDFMTLVRALKVQYSHDSNGGSSSSSSSRLLDSTSNADSNVLSYRLLGEAMWSSLYTTPCPINTMNGPIKQEVKVRAITQKQRNTEKEDMKKVKGQTAEIQENDGNEDQNDTSAARVKHMVEHVQHVFFDDEDDGHDMKKKGKQDAGTTSSTTNGQLDLLQTLVDPKDTVKTIENFFDFAFLLKEKMVEERIDSSTKLPVVRPSSLANVPNSSAQIPEKKQFIVSLNMGELEELQKLLYPDPEIAVKRHPLKRDQDIAELYDCDTIEDQIEKIKKLKRQSTPGSAMKGGKDGDGEENEEDEEEEAPKSAAKRSSSTSKKGKKN